MGVDIDSLRQAITQFDQYPSFLSEVVGANTIPSEDPNKPQVEFEIEVIKRFRYKLEFDVSDPNNISWRLLESDFFKKNQGSWKLTDKGNGETNVVYELDVGFGLLVPGFVSKKLTEVNLPRLLESFESQAKQVGGS